VGPSQKGFQGRILEKKSGKLEKKKRVRSEENASSFMKRAEPHTKREKEG